MPKMKPISEQVIVITGASSGIGLATAKMAAKKGARVVIASRNGSELETIAADLKKEGGKVLAVAADVTSPSDLENLRDQALRQFGRIDTWVNNAGLSIYGPLLEVPLKDEKQLFEINFWGIRHGCHAAVEAMKNAGGTIINLGSEVSGRAVPVQGMYSASKHAVKAYTDALRMELEHDEIPIRVSLIRPTAINTPFAEHAKNLLDEGEPSLPTPTYHPNVVAQAILNCAENPQRDVYVGGGSRLFDVLDTFIPGVIDKMMERSLFDQQIQGTKEPHHVSQEALHSPPAKEGEILGTNKGRMRGTSAYTSMAQHPWRSLAVVGAVIAIGSLLAKSGEKRAA